MEQEGVEKLLNALINAAHVYGLLTGNLDDDDFGLPLLSAKALELRHAGGESGYMLLMWLVLNRKKIELLDADLEYVANKLVTWFVRRNLTDYPATNAVQRLFSSIIKKLNPPEVNSKLVCQTVQGILFDPDNVASDEQFERALRGPIYEDNRGMTRFILSSLAEHDRTDEGWSDLWRKLTAKSNQYYLTIEHILPKTEHMTKEWVESLGGEENAKEIRNKYVHTIGNLTLSGFNSELGTMDFKHKRDRMDKAARNIGYRNGLSINRDVVDKDKWGAEEIEKRTDRLVDEAMRLFAI
ncbi:HNH endonuclease family protein [Bifidobacterium myosotis]|nr:HNH endonuclease family protein [Bifidobacterium myosotis]